MEDRDHRANLMIGAALALVMTLVGVYVAGYFASERVFYSHTLGCSSYERAFPAHILVQLYQPMAKLESAVTGDCITVYAPAND